jgi:Zn-dependent protease with chaperone function
MGGMAGIPSSTSAGIIMELAFRWWNRACEFSADRAGLLACGKPSKAVTALIKLEAGPSGLTQAGLQAAIQHIEAEDDELVNNLAELLASHPMIIKRIDEIREYASSAQYRNLQARVDQNLAN